MAKKEHDEIVLICNPSAGGRWKQLAGILDSAEAQRVRRVVTDSIDDIGPALASLSKRVQLVCIYGGDGTIQKILTEIYRTLGGGPAPFALVGGGTMNVTSRWSGWTDSPERNFRRVVQAYLTDQLVTRDVPLLMVRQGEQAQYGFTFGVGTVVRILNEWEKGTKSKLGALALAAKSLTAAWGRFPADFLPVLEQMVAEVKVDGVSLPYNRFAGVFCNITGQVVRLVAPFQHERSRETFYLLAYAINARELGTLLPLAIRGFIPIDPKTLIKPVSSLTQIGLTYFGKGSLPLDPRYVNRTASLLELSSEEKVFTVDGEIFQSTGAPFRVEIGPTLRLAIAP